MSYLVLARKWRPLQFDDVVGQQHISKTLSLAIEKDRVAHAYIFTGTRGVGKTTTARILARALNCKNGPTPTPCNVCESCKGVISGTSLSVMEIDGASNNSVADIRELRENIHYSSIGGGNRIIIIDEVHMLTTQAFNALLKTLEEPPAGVIFILATTEPHKIPATIQSRCQRFDFRRIGAEHIVSQLARICSAEKITYEQAALHLVAARADGSMRDALSLLDQVFAHGLDSLSEEQIRSILGLVSIELYTKIMDAVHTNNTPVLIDSIAEVLSGGFDPGEFLSGLSEFVRSLLFCKEPALREKFTKSSQSVTPERFLRLSDAFSKADLLRMIEQCRIAESELKSSTYPRFTLELVVLKLCTIKDSVSPQQLLALLEKAPIPQGESTAEAEDRSSHPSPPKQHSEPSQPDVVAEESSEDKKKKVIETPQQLPAQPAPQEQQEPAEPRKDIEQSVPEPLTEDPEKLWHSFLEHLFKQSPTVANFLATARASFSGDRVTLHFTQHVQFPYQQVNNPKVLGTITQAYQQFSGKTKQFNCTYDAQEQTAEPSVQKLFSKDIDLEQEIQRVASLKTLMEIFDGEIIE